MKFYIPASSLVFWTACSSTGQVKSIDLLSVVTFSSYGPDRYNIDCNSICSEAQGCLMDEPWWNLAGECSPYNPFYDSYNKFALESQKEICFHKYNDETCSNISETCESRSSLGVCDPNEKWEVEKDFCIASTEPIGDYITPMVERKFYSTPSDCATDYATTIALYPDDPTICVPSTEKKVFRDGKVAGGIRTFCSEENKLIKFQYSDRDCTSKENVAQFSNLGSFTPVGTNCTDFVTFMGTSAAHSSTCGAPRYYCKDFSLMEGVTITNWTGDPSRSSSSNSRGQVQAFVAALSIAVAVVAA